jgi:hypothetical protein
MRLKSVAFAVLALIAAAMPASARQLAVGAAPGYTAVPVYTWPNGGAWTPPDYSLGYTFREPIYSTPRGYKYIYVRGYYWKRVYDPYAPRVYRKVVKARAGKPRRGPCITDIGYGRHEWCNRFY